MRLRQQRASARGSSSRRRVGDRPSYLNTRSPPAARYRYERESWENQRRNGEAPEACTLGALLKNSAAKFVAGFEWLQLLDSNQRPGG